MALGRHRVCCVLLQWVVSSDRSVLFRAESGGGNYSRKYGGPEQ